MSAWSCSQAPLPSAKKNSFFLHVGGEPGNEVNVCQVCIATGLHDDITKHSWLVLNLHVGCHQIRASIVTSFQANSLYRNVEGPLSHSSVCEWSGHLGGSGLGKDQTMQKMSVLVTRLTIVQLVST